LINRLLRLINGIRIKTALKICTFSKQPVFKPPAFIFCLPPTFLQIARQVFIDFSASFVSLIAIKEKFNSYQK